MLQNSTISPQFSAKFLARPLRSRADRLLHQRLLLRRTQLDGPLRLLNFSQSNPIQTSVGSADQFRSEDTEQHHPRPSSIGVNNRLTRQQRSATPTSCLDRAIPSTPFRVLDAPDLRDDFYCTLIAYDLPTRSLAVALDCRAYIWTEDKGVIPFSSDTRSASYITSVDFSSKSGAQSILATGRHDGSVALQSLAEQSPRCTIEQSFPVTYVSWSPQPLVLPDSDHLSTVPYQIVENLLIGDDSGRLQLYTVHWIQPTHCEASGQRRVEARIRAVIVVHTQQICGIAWSEDGASFATGANDNTCNLFDFAQLIAASNIEPISNRTGTEGRREPRPTSSGSYAPRFDDRYVKKKWTHRAAVKAIAFCPWQPGLLATGGGSNDQCIHFFHTRTGSNLATIHVAAQVTSLVWSKRRREICATFGFASPDHPYRIATFSWPECQQITAIPWNLDSRALHAVLYSGLPRKGRTSAGRTVGRPSISEGTALSSRTEEEGCIVIASSNESIQFHEVWSNRAKPAYCGTASPGMLGGSGILEVTEGIDAVLGRGIR